MPNRKVTRCLAIFLQIVLAILFLTAAPVLCAKNIILMIGDGMGPEHVKAGSYYISGEAEKLCFEPFFKCTVTTCSNSSVTDSAAAATALATGHKTDNGMLSQSPTGENYETILEKAKAMGKRTGLVTTVPITHATPAGFGSHDPSRGNYIAIGDDYLDSTRPNVIFGAGDPNKGSTYFSTAQIAKAQKLGYEVIYDAMQLACRDTVKIKYVLGGFYPPTTKLKYTLGLFAKDDMTYESDRTPACDEPHLYEMAMTALSLLDEGPKGFFLMVEGGSIDHGAHANNIAVTTGEVAGFNRAVQTVLNWMKDRKDTLLIITADHETGGLTSINKGKGNYPEATWISTGHTAINVNLYATGADCDIVDKFIKNGVIDNTDVFKFMDAAYN